MKNTTLLLTIIIALIFISCAPKPKFKAYVPATNSGTKVVYKDKIVEKEKIVYKDKVVYKDKIVYQGGAVNSAENTRKNFSNSAQQFNFKKNKREDYNSYALIIGINEYKENSNVAYADYSALAFEKLVNTTFGVPKDNIVTMLNADASSGQIKAKLDYIKEIPEKGGTIYLFYAGHGVPGKDGHVYMLPADMSAGNIHLEPNLQLRKIYANLTKSLASNIFIFMDSCFSGQDDNGDLLYKGVAAATMVNKTKIRNKKLTVMTAGADHDFANNYEDKKQRLFSYHLIKELANGTKNLQNIYSKIRSKVKRTSLQKGTAYKQVPQLYGTITKSLY
ncbi:caspase family protein [Sulfurimonas sp.]|nr:caspase family protein [Sulfurimonas sp.]